MKLFILIDSMLYKINKDGILEEIKDVNIQKTTNGGVCLLGHLNKGELTSHYLSYIKDDKIPLNTLLREMTTRLNIFDIDNLSYLKNDSDEVIYYTKKVEIERIFKAYEFSKIIPLDYFLYKMGGEISGIISEQFIYLKQFKQIHALTQQNIIYESKVNPQQKLLEYLPIEEKAKSIFGCKIPLESEYDIVNTNLVLFDHKKIENLIKEIDGFIFEDKYSLHHQAKKVTPLLVLGMLLFGGLGGSLLYYYLQQQISVQSLDADIQGLQRDIKNIQADIKKAKSNDFLAYYKPFSLKNLFNIEDIVGNYEIFEYQVKTDKNTKNIKLEIKTKSNKTARAIINEAKGSKLATNRAKKRNSLLKEKNVKYSKIAVDKKEIYTINLDLPFYKVKD